LINLEEVTKIYPGTTEPAVDKVSLKIEKGNICVFVGPSGCGKSTILRMINHLVEPTSGNIYIEGKRAIEYDINELRRNIGYVIQQVGLLPHKTIYDNVALVPRLQKWSEGDIKNKVYELMEMIGLNPEEVNHKYPYQLSGGQMQRVGVARAMAANPEIMLMDEPFGAVDPIIRSKLQDEFLKLQQELKKTICFVTHDIEEAIKMGDYIVILNEGQVVQVGNPMEVLSAPANDFVKDLLGEDRGVKILDLTKSEQLMITDLSMLEDAKKNDAYIDGIKPVKAALEVMMSRDSDVVAVLRKNEVVGLLKWQHVKAHVSDVSGGDE